MRGFTKASALAMLADPQQKRHVAKDLDVDGHQARDQPVLGKPQYADSYPKDRGEKTGKGGHNKRVQQADKQSPPVGAVIGIGDQLLADVIARTIEQKGKVDVLVPVGKVLDGVVHQPDQDRKDQQEYDHLDCVAAVPCVINKLPEPETGFRRLDRKRHAFPLC